MTEHRIFLDLDNTILSAVPLEEMKWTEKTKEKAVQFEIHNIDNYYVVFERPYLQEFLDYLFANFKVSIWSAATKDYVLFIVNNIILKGHSERKIEYILFSYHCDLSKKECEKGPKDLRLVWDVLKLDGFSKENTLILDDLKKVFKTQPCNCIPAEPFEFENKGSENDDFLKRLVERLGKFKTLIPEKENLCLAKLV